MKKLSGETAESFLVAAVEAANELFGAGRRDAAILVTDVVGELTTKKAITEYAILRELNRKTQIKAEQAFRDTAETTLLRIFERFQTAEPDMTPASRVFSA